ncbi:hypothetical protein F5X68DRAFT_232748 [Plectosphaerella plurivora]|uniref:GST N-terminal domain-containing protein n=1 Tax=Plectosphaerella plurivora TaxID=936078 RepID=A0A9P9A9Z9_9PEZI|nr:hypothetical protein F5X68DRAFT_232748 [Plectosphaerella plurivora]
MAFLPADTKLTLFLWPEGMFPKQIVYYLLEKRLLTSITQLYEGKTTDPRLVTKIITFENGGLKDKDPNDPKPAGKSAPCLRITGPPGDDSSVQWIHESSAIRLFFEALYSEKPRLISTDLLEAAKTNDMMNALQVATDDATYYIKNAASVTTFWSGLRDEERSLAVAKMAKKATQRGLGRFQEWAAPNIKESGWLTPGLKRPGIVDVTLAAWARYMELSYAFDLFEGDELQKLASWYGRFKTLGWWEELEERGRHPKELTYANDCREV